MIDSSYRRKHISKNGISAEIPVFRGVVAVAGSKQEIKRRFIMIKLQRHGSIGAGLATVLAVAGLACATLTRAQVATGGSSSGGGSWIVSDGNGARRGPISDLAAPDSMEGQLRSEGKSWVRSQGPIEAGNYVQDLLQGRLDQPAGRGIIAKVLTVDQYIGMEHAWVDFGRSCIEHIRASELCPVRIFLSGYVAEDSLEGQLRSEGKSWERIRGQMSVGTYVESRVSQPSGKGGIGKVVSIFIDEQGRTVANVDFGRGWIVGISSSELFPIRIITPATPPIIERQPVPRRPDGTAGYYKAIMDPFSGRYAIVNSERDTVMMKDDAGRVLWSVNVIDAWMARHPMTLFTGEYVINSMEIEGGVLVVRFTGGVANLDKQTGEAKFPGSR
jgi:hypothetical protein